MRADLNATRRRVRRLEAYVSKNLLADNEFLCHHYLACSTSVPSINSFRSGVMSHVGRHFDLFLDGKPVRIVVVGQESGFPKGAPIWAEHVSLAARYEQVHDDSGLGRRYYREGPIPGRNPHMRGTTSALRIILGAGRGANYEGERIHPVSGKPFHIFDSFALVNRLLCSASPPNSSNGKPTTTMWVNCTEHFEATLRILEPTIVILQGAAVAKWAGESIECIQPYDDNHYRGRIGSAYMIVCKFSHPSAHSNLRWGDNPLPNGDAYLTSVVEPTLLSALSHS